MTGLIRIEIYPLGSTNVFIGHPGEASAANRLWRLYEALRPQIKELEQAAMREGPRIISQEVKR